MAYSGPAVEPMRLHFPYESKNGDPDWSKVVIERSGRALDTAFYRGALIAFRVHPSYNWIMRDVKQVGYPEQEGRNEGGGDPTRRGPRSSRVSIGDEVRMRSADLDDFMTYLDGKGRGSTRVHHEDDDFWKMYLDATEHPQVLLDVVARQAIESLKDL